MKGLKGLYRGFKKLKGLKEVWRGRPFKVRFATQKEEKKAPCFSNTCSLESDLREKGNHSVYYTALYTFLALSGLRAYLYILTLCPVSVPT